MKTCIMNARSMMCFILWLSIVASKKDSSSYLDLIKKRVQMVKERVRREKTTAIDLRRNAQTSSSNSTISASPAVSGNSTSSKNPFGNPDPLNGPWPECLGWDGTDCINYIKLLAPDVSNLQTIQPYYDDDTTTTSGTGSGGTSTITRVKRHRRKDIHRVWIIVDEYGVVSMNPHRA